MMRKHTITLEVTVFDEEEAFDPSQVYNYCNDVVSQRAAADAVVESTGIMYSAVANVETELELTFGEKKAQKEYRDAEEDDFTKRYKALDELGDTIGIRRTTFSMSEVPVEEMNSPMTAVDTKVRFVAGDDKFWGGEDSKYYRSDVVDNPTMMDAWKAFDESIEVTGDGHHIFLEGLQPVQMVDGVLEITFVTGS